MTPQPLHLLVRNFERHSRLSDDDRSAILALPHSIAALRASEFALRAGDAPQHCAVILKGIAGRQRQIAGGRQIVSLHIPGEPANLQHLVLDNAESGVQMLTAGVVATIPCEALSDLASSRPGVGRAVLASLAVEGSISREWLLNIGRRDASQRLAHLLCEFAARMDAHQLTGEYCRGLPLKHNQLADVLGLTPVHVGRILKQFAAEKLIADRKRPITVSNWERLRRMSAFDPAYLHLEHRTAAT